MDYRDRLRHYFKSQGDSLIKAGEKMGYSKSSMSNYLGPSRDINIDFLNRFIMAYPDVDLNVIFKEDTKVHTYVNEPAPVYGEEIGGIVEEIEEKLKLLKEKLPQK